MSKQEYIKQTKDNRKRIELSAAIAKLAKLNAQRRIK